MTPVPLFHEGSEFLEVPEFDIQRLEAAWREAVFALDLAEGKIQPEVVENMRSWKGSHLIRYYGWYSNKARGMRRKAAEAAAAAAVSGRPGLCPRRARGRPDGIFRRAPGSGVRPGSRWGKPDGILR
jgi:hypothetical protein